MWNRFKRWIRSVFGGALDAAEDPEKILNQNIKDMNDQIPVMNQNIATIRANVTLLENQKAKLQSRQEDLRNKIKAALESNRRDLALEFAVQLEQVGKDIEAADQQLQIAREAVIKADKVKQAFIAEKERRIREVRQVLAKARQAEWQAKVADAMESFEVGGITHTHEEMIRKVEEKAAVNQARMEMALDKVQVQSVDMDREAEKIRAEEILKQFELEMGLKSTAEAIPSPEKTVGSSDEPVRQAAESVKTVGPKTSE